MRINKYLATAGLGSRRKVEQLVLDGAIKVNGVIIKDLSTDISDTDKVEYLNRLVSISSDKVYYMLNKPRGVLTSCSDGHGRKLIIDYVPPTPKVFPVGRLDYETEGLIILTNDGDFANNIIHPRCHIAKTYEIVTNKRLSVEDKENLEKGVNLGDFTTLPSKISVDKKIPSGYLRQITIFEGKNRQIRKMFDHVGHSVISLKRISIGRLQLGDVPIGKYKKLNKQDLDKIFLGGK
ncbi:MAG: rRNA pseudouridine synthase [Clostridiales bacterium]|nr:rRNA pseudouridine synthase [Clostridiales bacterium]